MKEKNKQHQKKKENNRIKDPKRENISDKCIDLFPYESIYFKVNNQKENKSRKSNGKIERKKTLKKTKGK